MALIVLSFEVPDEHVETVSREVRGGILRHELRDTVIDWIEQDDLIKIDPRTRDEFTCEVYYDSTRDPNWVRGTKIPKAGG